MPFELEYQCDGSLTNFLEVHRWPGLAWPGLALGPIHFSPRGEV
jgi:hypothetical protein